MRIYALQKTQFGLVAKVVRVFVLLVHRRIDGDSVAATGRFIVVLEVIAARSRASW